MSIPSGRQSRVRAMHVACLALAGLALLLRIPSIAQPLGIDQSLWASAVRGMERGQRLYADVWEQRPPGIYLTYWAGFKAFGWTPAAVAWLDIIASAITTATLYLLARILAGRITGAVTAAFFATMTMPAWMYSNGGFIPRSICETFIEPAIALAALCAVLYRQRGQTALLFGLGLFAGIAVVYKPNAGIYFPAILAWALWPSNVRNPRNLLISIAGAAVVPLLVVLWLWKIDVLAEAKIAVVDFNRWYVSAGFNGLGYARAFADFVGFRVKSAPEPLWIVGVIGSLAMVWQLIRRRQLAPLPALSLAWGGAAVVVIAVNGMRIYYTYFEQAFAPLSLVAGWWMTSWWNDGTLKRWTVAAVLALSAVFLFQRNYVPKIAEDLTASLAELTGRGDHSSFLDRFGGYGATSRGYSARANEELAAYVRARTQPDDRVFLFGINGAGLYFLADRLTAHRFLRVNFFAPQDFPDPRFRLDAVVAELEQRRPVYVIFEQLHSTADPAVAATVDALPADPLVKGLLNRYALETTIEDFSLYRRR